jgi:enoyl reductase-like protein
VNYLSRDEILGADDHKYEDVDVPEWGGAVRVRSMTASVRDRIEESFLDKKRGSMGALDNMRAKVVAASVVDEHGKLLFTEADVKALGRKSSAPVNRVFSAAQRVSRMSDKDVEETVKNSESGQPEDSSSD